MGGSAVDSVGNSPQTLRCPRYPQLYDDGDLISEFFEHFQRITINTTSSGTTFGGNPEK
jgi:hypothetical protein